MSDQYILLTVYGRAYVPFVDPINENKNQQLLSTFNRCFEMWWYFHFNWAICHGKFLPKLE